MLENIICLGVCSLLTATAKKDRGIGYLVVAYYCIYLLIESSEFGVVFGNVFYGFDSSISWYLVCMAMSCSFSIWASYIYMNQGGAVWLYSAWLILDALLCSFLALSQSFETNALLIVYNVLQNINLYADIIIVVIGTDNAIKRNSKSAEHFINRVNLRADCWLDMVFNSGIKSAPKCKKKSTA